MRSSARRTPIQALVDEFCDVNEPVLDGALERQLAAAAALRRGTPGAVRPNRDKHQARPKAPALAGLGLRAGFLPNDMIDRSGKGESYSRSPTPTQRAASDRAGPSLRSAELASVEAREAGRAEARA